MSAALLVVCHVSTQLVYRKRHINSGLFVHNHVDDIRRTTAVAVWYGADYTSFSVTASAIFRHKATHHQSNNSAFFTVRPSLPGTCGRGQEALR